MHKISIVMAYYNRRSLLIKALESILSTKFKGDLEICIIDDASVDTHSVNDLPVLFPTLSFKIVQVDKKEKWWVNPCIPHNIGFAISSGDVIIIQNPECIHVGDIISYVNANAATNKYIVFGCYAVDQNKTKLLEQTDCSSIEDIRNIMGTPLVNRDSLNRWYQHSKFDAHCLNFCAAITKQDLEDLGGFDEAFAYGLGCDDTEFVYRVRRKNMFVDMVDDPFVIHQYHGLTDYSNKERVALNHNLRIKTLEGTFVSVTNKHTKNLVEKLTQK